MIPDFLVTWNISSNIYITLLSLKNILPKIFHVFINCMKYKGKSEVPFHCNKGQCYIYTCERRSPEASSGLSISNLLLSYYQEKLQGWEIKRYAYVNTAAADVLSPIFAWISATTMMTTVTLFHMDHITGLAPSQWETLLQSNTSHWLGVNLKSVWYHMQHKRERLKGCRCR